jgi:hypothetical protein
MSNYKSLLNEHLQGIKSADKVSYTTKFNDNCQDPEFITTINYKNLSFIGDIAKKKNKSEENAAELLYNHLLSVNMFNNKYKILLDYDDIRVKNIPRHVHVEIFTTTYYETNSFKNIHIAGSKELKYNLMYFIGGKISITQYDVKPEIIIMSNTRTTQVLNDILISNGFNVSIITSVEEAEIFFRSV